MDVALPLQEVLKNLPATSLRMRDDQEEQDAGANFATPFSAKAEEDAKRFKCRPRRWRSRLCESVARRDAVEPKSRCRSGSDRRDV